MSKAINLSGLKTLLEPLVHLINKKAERPDWNENDPSSPDYIENRTHWEIVEESQLLQATINDVYVEDLPFTSYLEEGQTYTVTWDGVDYRCLTYHDNYGGICVGNQSIGINLDDWAFPETIQSDEPFFICTNALNGYNVVMCESGNHTVETYGMATTVHKIDAKYLPEIVGAKGTGLKSEVFNDIELNTASGYSSHAEGSETTASGNFSHAEGSYTTASGDYSHAEGNVSSASGLYSHAECSLTTASGSYSHSEGRGTTASGESSHAEGNSTNAIGDQSHAEGLITEASGEASHAEGTQTEATGDYSHAEGAYTTSSGYATHSEGNHTTASGNYSHAEGEATNAIGECAHSEGGNTTASGNYSHAEGYATTASGNYSHAEGFLAQASGDGSHSGGDHAKAEGNNSFAFGVSTETKRSTEFTIGAYNYSTENSGLHINKKTQEISFGNSANEVKVTKIEPTIDLDNKKLVFVDTISKNPWDLEVGDYVDYDTYYYHILAVTGYVSYQIERGDLIDGKSTRGTNVFTVGNGNDGLSRSNAHTLDWSGNAWYAGNVYVGSTSGKNKDAGSKKLATEEYVIAQLNALREEILGGEW